MKIFYEEFNLKSIIQFFFAPSRYQDLAYSFNNLLYLFFIALAREIRFHISNSGSTPSKVNSNLERTEAMCITHNTRAHLATLIVIELLEHFEHFELPHNY